MKYFFLASADVAGHSVIYNISLCIVAASILGLLARIAKQPVMLGHLVAGALLGPVGFGFISNHADIVTVSEIGLILLLFMIGLEIDLRKMLSTGKWIVITGIIQFPLCAALGYVSFSALRTMGFAIGNSEYAALYLAVIISMSSTMIVVKILHEKREIDTLTGRITIGILVFQDIWAIIFLAIQPNLSDPKLTNIAVTFASGIFLVVSVLLVSKFVLPRVFRIAATSGELMLILALGWCFFVSLVAAHPVVGLSMEMGALIAGMSLATFPYSMDVLGKVINIRDFFITLFFVSLAMQIPIPSGSLLSQAAVTALLVFLSRCAGVYMVLYFLRAGHRASLLCAINLSQISEFGLVIASIGISHRHIDENVLTHVIWVFAILAVASSYLLKYNDSIQRTITQRLTRAGIPDIAHAHHDQTHHREFPIVIMGFYRNASSTLYEIRKTHPDWLDKIKVIDINPNVKSRLDAMGVTSLYGDISHKETLEHAHLSDAKVLLCSIPDYILKGTTNLKLLELLKGMCPNAVIIVTAENPEKARQLYASGASFVIQPSLLSGSFAKVVLEKALSGTLSTMRDAALDDLAARDEVLS